MVQSLTLHLKINISWLSWLGFHIYPVRPIGTPHYSWAAGCFSFNGRDSGFSSFLDLFLWWFFHRLFRDKSPFFTTILGDDCITFSKHRRVANPRVWSWMHLTFWKLLKTWRYWKWGSKINGITSFQLVVNRICIGVILLATKHFG